MTDAQLYECYVGSLTPEEFVKGYENCDGDCIHEAIKGFLRQWPWEEPIPDGLVAALYRYVASVLEEE